MTFPIYYTTVELMVGNSASYPFNRLTRGLLPVIVRAVTETKEYRLTFHCAFSPRLTSGTHCRRTNGVHFPGSPLLTVAPEWSPRSPDGSSRKDQMEPPLYLYDRGKREKERIGLVAGETR